MRRQLTIISMLFVMALFFVGCGSADDSTTIGAETTDEPSATIGENATNDEEKEDHRIVATTVALVEIMDALELDLVGVPTSYKGLPERYADATEVGMAAEPDMEIIKSLKPTDVLSATTLDAEFDLEPIFDSADVPVTFVDMESIEGMYESILSLGEDYNRTEQAEQIVLDFDHKVENIEAKVEGQEPPSVLILLGVPGSYLVATENSYLGDLIARAGGKNVFEGKDDIEYTSANTEHLQQTNPDIILRAAHGMPEAVVEMFEKEFKENDIWQHFKAVQDNRVYDLDETLFGTTANLSVPEALEELVEMFYPDAQ